MVHKEQWIWLPGDKYPNIQTTSYDAFENKENRNYAVAEFSKVYIFDSKIVNAHIRFSGDTSFRLYCNNKFIATGPACVGGDFIGNGVARPNYYAFETEIHPESNKLDFFARVKMGPAQICEYSKGHGGFMLSAIITFEDGTQQLIYTDDTWSVRLNGAYKDATVYDCNVAPCEYTNAQIIENIWNAEVAPIPIREENEITYENGKIDLLPTEEKTIILESDKVWAGFLKIISHTQGEVLLDVTCREIDEEATHENLTFNGKGEYIGFYMHSSGNIKIVAKNNFTEDASFTVSFIETHYPVKDECETKTSDNDLNTVLDTCKHTLKICRQTHHLDSPRHCEPMACTGDYYIESLMTMFTFGDMRLCEFDLLRTAVMLQKENGRMFHTTYSLIWIRMLYDVYMATGNIVLLEKCENALSLLLNRFETYMGNNGLIETPPDYMFIDWIYIDGISMHHPPKALGQTCLNMFYFGGLDYAERIYTILSLHNKADKCKAKHHTLQKAINTHLFDKDKGMYFMGLNTPTPQNLLCGWMPQNTDKRYYMKHANILAAYFGVCDDATGTELIKKVVTDKIPGDCQPYFLHYLLEAVYRLDLRDDYTLKILNKWKEPVLKCTKGLVEGFIAPEPTYSFDHSHAWGGTPAYSLPKALMGLEILSPGMSEVSLSPSLLGLEYAHSEVLTPFGKIICDCKKGEKPVITHPENIKISLR